MEVGQQLVQQEHLVKEMLEAVNLVGKLIIQAVVEVLGQLVQMQPILIQGLAA
jgi:hypothetical protein